MRQLIHSWLLMRNSMAALLRFAGLALVIVLFRTPAAMAVEPQKITVYGGSGHIGQRIVNEALNRGHIVTVVVRKPEEFKQTHTRLTVTKGDILDNAGVAKQIAGQDAVISSVNSGETEFFLKAAQSLVQAVRGTQSMPRIIWVGGASSLEVAPGKRVLDTMSNVPPGGLLGHTQVLEYFRGLKDVNWTFMSPPQRIEPGKRTGEFRVGGDQLLKDEKGESRISMEDFAVAVMNEIEKPQHVRARFTVGY